MHVSWQILSPVAAQAYGVQENWSGIKGDIQGCQVGDFIAKFSKTGEIWTPFG